MTAVAKAGMVGLRPSVKVGPAEPIAPKEEQRREMTEKEKYTHMWTIDNYRDMSPGELAGNTFLQVVKPEGDEEVIDFGCGTGRGSMFLGHLGGLKCTMVDFAANCLDEEMKEILKNYPDRISFMEHDLTQELGFHKRYGYCTDVMEHIPPEQIDLVLHNILKAARSVFFRISTIPDAMGPAHLGFPLHLSVHDFAWWEKKFIEVGCIIMYSEDINGECADFYVTSWRQTLPDMTVNIEEPAIEANIRENAKWGCKHVSAHAAQDDVEIIMLAGGPSLNDYKDEIIEKWKGGAKVVTVNGAYHWALENGITNVNQCMLDARPFNKRFVEPVLDTCQYFIASQCDPSVFEILPPDKTFYWHVLSGNKPHLIDAVKESYPEHTICNGGSTVVLRAMVLMRILGFRNQTIYGMDSCLREDKHHAYEQEENDPLSVQTISVEVEGRVFECQPWMSLQAFEFMRMMETVGHEFNITVKGDGLIAHIIETGATLPEVIKE